MIWISFWDEVLSHSLVMHFSWQPVTLELGGKSPIVVFDDVDIETGTCLFWDLLILKNGVGVWGLLLFAKEPTDKNATPLEALHWCMDFSQNTRLSRVLEQELLWHWKLIVIISSRKPVQFWGWGVGGYKSPYACFGFDWGTGLCIGCVLLSAGSI